MFTKLRSSVIVKPKARLCEPWVRFVGFGEPRSGDRECVNKSRYRLIAVAPSGLGTSRVVDPRLAKPRPRLNSDRCSAAVLSREK